MTISEKAAQAALNNAVWCDAVCRSQGVPGEFQDAAWINPGKVPQFYPNLITLGGAGCAEAQRKCAEAFLRPGGADAVSVKDSFQTLDLALFGFEVLFDAQWLYLAASAREREASALQLRWEAVSDAAALTEWEAAWSGGETDAAGIFLPVLLTDKDIAIIAAYDGKRIVAGAIANRAAEAVGLSNIFAPAEQSQQCRRACIAHSMAAFPGLPFVGYEAGEDLMEMKAIGFEPVGPLSVWIRSSRQEPA